MGRSFVNTGDNTSLFKFQSWMKLSLIKKIIGCWTIILVNWKVVSTLLGLGGLGLVNFWERSVVPIPKRAWGLIVIVEFLEG